MTPAETLLARVVANNEPRKLLEILLKHDGLALGVELNQGEKDVLAELKPVAPVYDLKAMKFDPRSTHLSSIQGVFFRWGATPEGGDYWCEQAGYITPEGHAKIAAMRKQYEKEK